MIITRTSPVSGITRSMDLPISEDQLEEYRHGALLQDAFPALTDDQREFFMSGITDEEWNSVFGDD